MTISGLLGAAKTAGILGAVLTLIISIRKEKDFEVEADWYGKALTKCNVFVTRITIEPKTPDNLLAILMAFNELIAGEGDKQKKEDQGGKPTTVARADG